MKEHVEIRLMLPKPPSLNKYFNSKHWGVQTKYKKEYNGYIKEAMDQYEKFYAATYKIDVIHNTRYDCDNAIIAVKFISDYLKDNGYVTDDTRKYFKGLSIRVAEDADGVNKNEVLVKIKLYDYEQT
jgi:Holliday junction resolvase RusA-like endonuclease